MRKQLTEEKILTELHKITGHLEEEYAARKVKEEWHYTMKVFDRFFFVVFFFYWVCCLCVFFLDP
jgi:hypothetical protein